MKRKIVADSSADLLELPGVDFVSVPLNISAGEHQWVDDADLDVSAMMEVLSSFRGHIGSACPSPEQYLNAFGDADEVFVVPISRGMSASYDSACMAARDYMEQHPDRRVHVVDTLLACAPMTLLCEELAEMLRQGLDYDTVVAQITARQQKTRLLFCLQSVHTLANNGRMPQAVAALIGLLNIRLIAIANAEGKGEMVGKARGDKKALPALIEQLHGMGYDGRRLIIHHCNNEALALSLAELVRAEWPQADVDVGICRGLCSTYAENGGMLIGFGVN